MTYVIPAGIPVTTLTGRFLHPDGSPATGSVSFRGPRSVAFAEADTIVVGPIQVPLDDLGQFSVTLVSTDTVGMSPSGWTYVVTERIPGAEGRTYPIFLPHDPSPVDLADIAPSSPMFGVYLPVVGPRGPTGATGPAGTAGATGPAGAQGTPTTVNGKSGTSITLTASDVSADAAGAASAAQAAAATDASSKVAAEATRADGAYLSKTDPAVTNSRAPTGAAGGALTGAYPNPALSTATTAGFDAAGSASTAQSAAATDATSKVTAHTSATDPHGDRAAAAGALSGHVGAADPHGDRAAASTALGTHAALTTAVHGIADTSALVTSADSRLTNSRTPSGAATGDLTGSYPNPGVARINGVGVTGTPAAGQVPTATGITAATWQALPSGSTSVPGVVQVDGTAGDIAPLGTQAAGAVGKVADAGHVHAMPRLDQVLPPTASVALGGQKLTSQANGTTSTDGAAFGQIGSAVTTHAGAADPHGDRAAAATSAAGLYLPNAVVNLASFLSTNPFYIAHRGSGGEFPEHTMAAYEGALAVGSQAIEVSSNITADGIPVCIHDTTLDRTTYTSGNVADWTYAALRNKVLTNGKLFLGQGWNDQPIPTLVEVLDRYLGKAIIFLEAKSSPTIPVVQALLLSRYPQAARSVVWKNYYTNSSFAWAKSHGFTTWAYVDPTTTAAQMDAVDGPNIDMWGLPYAMSDALMTAAVARGKPTICWEVHRRSEQARLSALGVQGMMCAEYIYVRRATASRTVSDWATQIKAPGDIGTANYDTTAMLHYDTDGSAGVYINQVPNQSVLLGSFSPVAAPTAYTLHFDMKFELAPAALEHAGIAFGKASDDVYKFGSANATGGYHMALRANGDMQLYTHTAGVIAGTQLATIPTAAPVSNTYMSFTIQVTPTQVIVTRTDGTPVTLTVTNNAFRGGYVHLSTGSVSTLSTKPHWRNFSVT